MAKLVGETLDNVCRYVSLVVNDIVASRIHSSAGDRLTHDEEIEPIGNDTALILEFKGTCGSQPADLTA